MRPLLSNYNRLLAVLLWFVIYSLIPELKYLLVMLSGILSLFKETIPVYPLTYVTPPKSSKIQLIVLVYGKSTKTEIVPVSVEIY